MRLHDRGLRVLCAGMRGAVTPIHVGFTGTQVGMTVDQVATLTSFLALHPNFVGRHGVCVGADEQFDRVARAALGFEYMELHPCNLLDKRGQVPQAPRDVWHPALGPLQRNEIIVRRSDLVIATPKEDHMILRSGTWTTVRYALKAGKPVHVILPNGALVQWR